MSEQPRTAGGQEFMRLFADLSEGIAEASGSVLDVDATREMVLAIEAEATAAPAADAWQAGYEACWNRLKDAGRLLPSDAAAVPLDVERLARALHQNCTFVRLSPHPLDRCERCTREARALSAKYDRLSEGVTA